MRRDTLADVANGLTVGRLKHRSLFAAGARRLYLLQIFQTQSEAEQVFYLMDTEDHSATDNAVGT
jgi:hypothetical protein